MSALGRIRKRPQYQYVAHNGHKFFCRYFVLQGVYSPENPSPEGSVAVSAEVWGQVRFGFIVTRKNGGAVVRNRIKRRLKEACRAALQMNTLSLDRTVDIVVIGNARCIHMPFSELVRSLAQGMRELCGKIAA